MNRWLLASALGLASVEGLPPTATPDPTFETVRWSGTLPGAGGIEIDNPRGDLRLRGAEGEEVELVASLQRLGSPERRAEVQVTPSADRLAVRVRVPEGARGRFEDRVDLVVLVPRAARVVARAGFGRLETRGLVGPLEVSTESGALTLDLRGAARARTVSGRIEAHVARPAMSAGVDLGSGSGGVRVDLARDAEGEIEVRSRDRILFDLALPFRGEPAPAGATPVRGRVGTAPGRLAIETGGEVQLLWGRAAGPSRGGER